jgi:hypothetical protein
MRRAQLNSTEDDVADMDIPFWMDYFRRIHADALCITAGGVVAFYPTKVPYHRPSRWLSQRPGYFPEVVNECKRLGTVVVARTDPHATYHDVYRDDPDWLADVFGVSWRKTVDGPIPNSHLRVEGRP